MVTLTFGDFAVLFLMNLVLAAVVAYVVNYAKRSAELSAEEGSSDKEYLKKVIRESISEARSVLTELRVHEFNIPTGRRRLARMNSLAEKLNLVDVGLGTKLWRLVNAPIFIGIINETYKGIEPDPEVTKYRTEITNSYYKDLEWALQRCAEIEKNPIVKK